MTTLLLLALTLTNSVNLMPPTNLPTLRVVRQIGGPVAIVRPPSTNWIVRPFKAVPGGTNLWRLDKSTDLGRTWTMIRSNMTGTASNTNSDVWDADRLPNAWYRLERQAMFYNFTTP